MRLREEKVIQLAPHSRRTKEATAMTVINVTQTNVIQPQRMELHAFKLISTS